MRKIYFVTEGATDKIVIEGLVERWLGKEDFLPRHIQPPSSAYAQDLDSNLSEGWKGVLAWCAGERPAGPAGRNEAIKQADCLIIHTDADVATDPAFKSPVFEGDCPPARDASNWVRDHLVESLGGTHANVVFCVPAQALEAWVLCALHPDVADANAPIECRQDPGALLVQRPPHRLVRGKQDGRLQKQKSRYQSSLPKIVRGWTNCTAGETPRCPEAARFERDLKQILDL